jgi:hypothetical protein
LIRYEFPKPVKRLAVARAKGRCEASGPAYGLPPGHRCNSDLGRGFEIDHYPVQATEKGSDTLENAVVCCPICHSWKTRKFDIPVQAKIKRVSDRHLGLKPSRPSFATNRNGKFRKRMDGTVVPREGEI